MDGQLGSNSVLTRSINSLNGVSDIIDSPIICLMGATATGKTQLAADIAENFPVEIISVDSALVYRDMNVGTAKPDSQLLSLVPHFLIDIIDPVEVYSAWDFVKDARQLITEISQRGNIPLLVGGTMMYFHALEQGLNRLPEADQAVRGRIDAEALVVGWPAMHQKLAAVDPAAALRIKPRDSQRIQRALEVYEVSGQSLTRLQAEKTEAYSGAMTKIVLNVDDRAELHGRIKTRFHDMLRSGFVDEVAALKSRNDLTLSMPSMRCVGYRQIWQYLDGEFEEKIMIEKALASTRQLAKRQMTWLRKQSKINSFNCLSYEKDAIFKTLGKSILGL